MTQIADLPEDLQPLAMKAAGLREQNSKLFEKLEGLGGGAEIATARIEHALVFLADIGVITERQRWEEAVRWETVLREQLQYAVEQVEQIRAASIEEQKRQARVRKLIVP